MSKMTLIASLLLMIVCPSCSKDGGERGVMSHGGRAALGLDTGGSEGADFSDPGDFFTLDYTPMAAEAAVTAKSMGAAATRPLPSKASAKKKEAKRRELKDYLVEYKDTAEEVPPAKIEIVKADISSGDSNKKEKAKPFTVCDWGPQGAIPAQVRFPSFYVLFSEPVTALQALGEVSAKSPYMKITPPIKGIFRWKGTSLLTFDAAEAADPMTQYTITVSEGTKSMQGSVITGSRVFKTQAAPLAIKWMALGGKDDFGIDMNDAPIAAAKKIRVCFNYAVKAEAVSPLVTIAAQGKQYEFLTVQEKIDAVSFEVKEDFPLDTEVTLRIKQPAASGGVGGKEQEAIERKIHTLRPLAFVSHSEYATTGRQSNPVRLVFSHSLDEGSVLDALSCTPKKTIAKDNVEVSGNCITVSGLDVLPREKYEIAISPALRDVWGQPLVGGAKVEVEVPAMPSTARFLEGGVKMLEAQFPHRIVFEYQNANSAKYKVVSTDMPLSPLDWNNRLKDDALDKDSEAVPLDVSERDRRVLRVVELDKYLAGGKDGGWKTGSVRFDAAIKLPKEASNWDPSTEWTATNTTTVQVTDIGITARFAVNKVAAMVTSLSTGNSVAGAVLNVYHKTARYKAGQAVVLGTAVTDKNGLAVIDIDSETAKELYRDDADDASDDSWYGSVILEAVTDGDRAVFVPDSHSSWRSGVEQSSIKEAYSQKARIFMFSDRGLYKPGETISFRGIDRDQKLGAFLPYKGGYTVVLKSASWRDETVYATASGVVSEEGGFAGSFKVPDEAEPGGYQLVYTRQDKDAKKVQQSVPVTVSFFERLRFQCGIEMPSVPVITGGKIGATLSASYLAGGALSLAEVTSHWYREPWYFTSSDAAFKGYRFGPLITGGRQVVASGKGALDPSGTLLLSCETSGEALKGVPYRYRLSCDVMDESRQAISAAGITVVHPAACYLGVSGPDGVATFPKAGEKLNFNYKWAALDGTALEKSASLLGAGKKITVTLLRDEWNVIKQQGVSGYIYNRYEKVQVEESSAQVEAKDAGKISVTALKPGNHTLRLETTDSAGRYIVTETAFYATGQGIVSWYSDDAAAIRLTPNKARYTPGETATLLMESPLPAGDYLITVEREGIFTSEVRHFEGNVQTIDVKIARNFLPLVYVSVSSYSVRSGEPKHQYGEVDLDKPKGYYGVTPIFVDPKVKSFSVKLDAAGGKGVFRPGEEAEITLLATKGGVPVANAELTLMAVDRGVLDLVDYHVDDPISFFYASGNFPLQVFGGDSRALLMDPVTYAVNNLAGGDAMMKSAAMADKLAERKDFNPTAAFIPVVKTDADGRATCRFKLPDTLTTYRITVFGVKGELLSLQEDEIAVQNPINVQQVLPRRMRERDTAETGVLITNLDNKDREVSVALEFADATAASAGNDGVSPNAGKAVVDGKAKQKVTVAKGSSETVYFDVAALEAGTVQAVFTIRSDVLNERLVCPLVIEKPYIFETVTTTGQVAGKDNKATEQVSLPGLADDGKGSLSVTLDATRLGLLGGAVQYLFDYPYGCMEQQASRLLPLVAFGEYIDVFGLDNKITDVKKCVKSIFKGMKQSQHTDGGFGYWPDARNSDLYISCRILHVAALALKRGYSKQDLSIDVDALASYVEKAGNSAAYNVSGYYRAYMLYVLSLFGRKISVSDLRASCEGEGTSISTLAFSGMASINAGDGAFAKECAARIRSFIRPTAQGADLTDPRGNSANLWCFCDGQAERLALAMQLFTMLNKDDEMIGRLLFQLMAVERGGYWKSTAETARVLDAFYTLIKAQNIDSTNLTAAAILGKTKLLEAKFKGAQAKPMTVKEDFSGKVLKGLPRGTLLPLDFTKSGKGNLYYTASLRYAIPEERQTPRDEGISVHASIYDNTTDGEVAPLKQPNVKDVKGSSVINLTAGKTYRVVIDLSTTYDRAFLAVRAPIPSGAEILDATFVTTSDEATERRPKTDAEKEKEAFEGTYYGGRHWLTQRVIRDNEVQFFYDRFGRGRDTLEFVFRATRCGVYPTPPATAQCMYEEEIFGRSGGTLFVIQ